MSRKIAASTTKEYLKSISLPNHGGRYTPISHESIIDTTLTEIQSKGLAVKSELYRSTVSGNIANGIVLMDHGSDMDLKMVLAWGNSYDKSRRFTCGIGVYIMSTKTFMFAGNMSNYARKHTGKADQEAMDQIKSQIQGADIYYDALVDAKNMLKEVVLTEREIAEAIGRLFIEKQVLTKEQVGGIYDMLKTKTKMFEDLDYTNAWNVYNIIAKYLRESHPKVWFESQCDVHHYFMTDLLAMPKPTVALAPVEITVPLEVPTNQLNLLDAIAEAEKETEPAMEPATEEVNEIPLKEQEESTAKSDDFVTFETESDNRFDLPDL
jgi:hypothetical protein